MGMVSDIWHVSTTCRLASIINSASRWATGECLGSKWGRISPEIHWTWFQTHNMCLPRVDTCSLLTLLPNGLQTSVRGQIGLEFCQESNGHGLRHLTCVLHRSNMWFTFGLLGYFWSLWATDKSEGSKLGGILPGIQWSWSQARDMCPTRKGNRDLVHDHALEHEDSSWCVAKKYNHLYCQVILPTKALT